jgi:hypothetical protein
MTVAYEFSSGSAALSMGWANEVSADDTFHRLLQEKKTRRCSDLRLPEVVARG